LGEWTSGALLSLAARVGSPVLLHHATYASVPDGIKKGLHNVTPQVLHRQLELLKRYFKFLPLDEYAEATDLRGLAALTFDDAYKCVFGEALPVLEALEIPAAVFINTCSFAGRVLWRDKVRYVLNHGLEEEWHKFTGGRFRHGGKGAYKVTKHPSNNSREVERFLDEFLASRDIMVPRQLCCIESADALPRHPLITYGNHSRNHYVLSSLSPEEQRQEIEQAHRLLAGIEGLRHSSIFSLPFGGPGTFDTHTVAILKEMGYKGYLLSWNRLNQGVVRHEGLRVIDRLMPREGRLPLTLCKAVARALLRKQPGPTRLLESG